MYLGKRFSRRVRRMTGHFSPPPPPSNSLSSLSLSLFRLNIPAARRWLFLSEGHGRTEGCSAARLGQFQFTLTPPAYCLVLPRPLLLLLNFIDGWEIFCIHCVVKLWSSVKWNVFLSSLLANFLSGKAELIALNEIDFFPG